jgi:hypothetical protein
MNVKIQSALFFLLISTFFLSCNKEPVPPPEPVIERISVAQLREMHQNGILSVDTNVMIRGTITLTPELGNLPDFVVYLQDSTAGICLTVSGDNTFALNSEVEVLCRGASFTLYNGLLQFGDISIADQVKVVRLTAEPPVPAKVTLADLLAGKHQAEYVMIENVQFRDPGNFSGTKVLTDCNQELDVYTRSGATFASEKLPTGNGTIKGVISQFNKAQLILRDHQELQMSGDRCGLAGVVYLQEDFTTLAKYGDVSTLQGWKTYSQAGGKSWYGNEVSSRKWVQATAYNSGQAEVVTWMIAPVADLTLAVKPYLSFDSADGYDNGATMELMASTDYSGSPTPWTSTWTPLTFTRPASNPSGYSQFVSSGQVDLSSFKGKQVFIAWVYRGADPSGSSSDKTTTWEVDNVTIAEK